MARFNTITLEQGSDEWLDWRNGGVTATNAVVIGARLKGVKYYPKESVYRTWAEKTGVMNHRDLSGDPNVQRGKELEDTARLAAEAHFNDLLIPLCVESKFDPKIRASLDGITKDGHPVELKCPAHTTWDILKKEGENSLIFKRYWIQVQHQLLAVGSTKGYLCFYVENEDLLIFNIEADKRFLGRLYALENEFWEHVQNRIPPEKDLKQDHFIPSGEDAKDWIYHSEHYKNLEERISDLNDQIKALRKEQSASKEVLQELIGNYKTGEFNGLQVTQYERRGSLDSSQLVERLQEIDPTFNEEEFRKPDSTVIRVSRTGDDVPRDLNDEEVHDLINRKNNEYKSSIF